MIGLRGDEGLITAEGGMGGGKSTEAIKISNDLRHTHNLVVVVVQPSGSERAEIDRDGHAGARSGISIDSKVIPATDAYLSLNIARELKADVVTYLDAHMFEPGPLIGAIFANRRDGRTCLVDMLSFTYGGDAYKIAQALGPRADVNLRPMYKRCDCQGTEKQPPRAKYSQLIVNTPFSRRAELLELLQGEKNAEMRALVEFGTEDPKTGLILPAYCGPRNITGNIVQGDKIPDEEVSAKLDYEPRCSACFVRPYRLDQF
jgi:hypothetical protein